MDTKYTFWTLIEDYAIYTPPIQRDYAQGRKEEHIRRESFLNYLFKSLLDETTKEYSLDFIYGRIDGNSGNTNNIFNPIDGQQRLTTLFLLHWFILKSTDNDSLISCGLKKLIKYSYSNRISSAEFCEAICIEHYELNANEPISESIIKQPWYRDRWNSDPTIDAMKHMLDAIQMKCKDPQPSNPQSNPINTAKQFEHLWEKLTTTFKINFNFFDLGQEGFKLTDELYIKMNARGKQLTSFENFKAFFIGFLEESYDKVQKIQHNTYGEITYSDYFSYRIDKEWADLFWSYRQYKVLKDDEESNSVIDSDGVNTFTINYIHFVAHCCYFLEHGEANIESYVQLSSSLEGLCKIFKHKKYLLILFNSLDTLYNYGSIENSSDLKNNLNSNLFNHPLLNLSVGAKKDNNYEVISFFEYILRNGIDSLAEIEIKLFFYLKYLIEFNDVQQALSFSRITRNYLSTKRQRKDTQFTNDIRINRIKTYWEDMNRLSFDANPYKKLAKQKEEGILAHEQFKAQLRCNLPQINSGLDTLEDFQYIEGLTHNLMVEDVYEDLNSYNKFFSETWCAVKNNLRLHNLLSRAFIACGFDGLYIKDCALGETYIFGHHDNWNRILTEYNYASHVEAIDNIKKALILFYNIYIKTEGTPEERLQLIIDEKLNQYTSEKDKDYTYYFLKYDCNFDGYNYFSFDFNDDDKIDFSHIETLNSIKSSPASAYHSSIYNHALAKKIKENSKTELYPTFTLHRTKSKVWFSDFCELDSIEKGWYLSFTKDFKNTPKLTNIIKHGFIAEKVDSSDLVFEDQKKRVTYLIHVTPNQDKVELAYTLYNKIIHPVLYTDL